MHESGKGWEGVRQTVVVVNASHNKSQIEFFFSCNMTIKIIIACAFVCLTLRPFKPFRAPYIQHVLVMENGTWIIRTALHICPHIRKCVCRAIQLFKLEMLVELLVKIAVLENALPYEMPVYTYVPMGRVCYAKCFAFDINLTYHWPSNIV